MIRRISGSAVIPLALAAAAVAAYAGAGQLGFVFDDGEYVVRNRHLADGPSGRSLWWALTAFYSANWHPLTWISHMLDVRLFGMAPAGHHAVSVALHVANTLVLQRVLQRLTGSAGRSGFVAGLFALHPFHVESVAWISERKDVLCTLFGLLALGAYVRYARRPSPGRYASVCTLFVLSLMAKPMLVTVPFVLLLLDWWPLGRWHAAAVPGEGLGRWREPGWLLMEKAPLIVLSAASAAVTLTAQSSWEALSAEASRPAALRVQNALLSAVRYLNKALWPKDLSVIYPFPDQGLPWLPVTGALLALMAATALVLSLRRSRPVLTFGWLFYLGTLVPVIGFVQVGSQAMADRYSYVPLLGFFLAVTWGAADLVEHRRGGRAALAVVAVLVLAALGTATRTQLGVWRDDVTLFEHAARVTPANAVAHQNLGLALGDRGRLDEARGHLEAALRVRPGDPRIQASLGALLQRTGQPRAAVGLYRRAILRDPGFAEAHFFLGTALTSLGDARGAESHFRQALKLRPDYAEAAAHLRSLPEEGGRHAP